MNWIPVSERLPEHYETVLVWTTNDEYFSAYLDLLCDGKPRFCVPNDEPFGHATNVTHWCIPTPPSK